MYSNLHLNVMGSFNGGTYYTSSTENDANNARYVPFWYNGIINSGKGGAVPVRAVRAF
jgi:hypothetical protein